MEKCQNKKRDFSHNLHDHLHYPKKPCKNSFPSGFGAESAIVAGLFSAESWSYIETFLRSVVREEVESKVESHFSCLNDPTGEEEVARSKTLQFKLRFLNKISSVVFTNNRIKAENGEPLQVALCATNFNCSVRMDRLSSAMIEFVVLNKEFGPSEQDQEEINWSVSDFNKNVLTQRLGKGPLIVGNDRRVRLNDGVAVVNHLSFTDNSSWMRTKQFRLGVRIIDEEILATYPRIGEAVSIPVRVMDHRGEVNKKHHTPRPEDELWRLEGIRRDGEYHKRLYFNGIKTVDDFVKAYRRDPRSLKKLLGNRVPNKTWNAMVDNALKCVPLAMFNPIFEQFSAKNEAMEGEAFNGNLEVDKQKISRSNQHELFPETFFNELFEDDDSMFEEYPSLLPHGEASTSYNHNYEEENTNTCNKYYQGA